MENTTDEIIEISKEIINLERSLKSAKSDEDRKKFEDEIGSYKSYIDSNTNNQSGFILTCVRKMCEAQEKLKEEPKEHKQSILENTIRMYRNQISSHIIENEISQTDDKFSAFRKNQKSVKPITPFEQARQIDKMCTEHIEEIQAAR